LEQVAGGELLELVDFILMAAFAGDDIINDCGALIAQSALAVLAYTDGGPGGVIEAIHKVSLLKDIPLVIQTFITGCRSTVFILSGAALRGSLK
jgi:hypothetical protein